MNFNFDQMNREKVMKSLEEYIDGLIRDKNLYKEKVETFNKEVEIKKLKEEINEIRKNSLIILSEKESKDRKAFSEEHFKSCKSNVIYILEGTGIGMGISVKCKKCGVEKDITDVDNW